MYTPVPVRSPRSGQGRSKRGDKGSATGVCEGGALFTVECRPFLYGEGVFCTGANHK